MVNGCPPSRSYAAHVHRLGTQIALLAAVFAAGVLLAELLGASSLGIAFGFGQIAFTLALGWFLLRA